VTGFGRIETFTQETAVDPQLPIVLQGGGPSPTPQYSRKQSVGGSGWSKPFGVTL